MTFSLVAMLMRVSPLTTVRLPPLPTGPTGVSLVGTGVGMRSVARGAATTGAPAVVPAGRTPPE